MCWSEGKNAYFCSRKRELSSVGSEHLPYKQGVAGSNPTVPTLKMRKLRKWLPCFVLEGERKVNEFFYGERGAFFLPTAKVNESFSLFFSFFVFFD